MTQPPITDCEQPEISTPDTCFYERRIVRPTAMGKCKQGFVIRRTTGPGISFCIEEEPKGYECPKSLGQCSKPRVGGYMSVSEAYHNCKRIPQRQQTSQSIWRS